MVLVRFFVHGAARVDAALRRHRRRALSRLCREELVAYDGLSLRSGRTSLLPRQHLFRPARSQRQEGFLEPRQWLGHGRACPHAAVASGKPSEPRAFPAIVSGNGRKDSDRPATRWPLAFELARSAELSAQRDERFRFLRLRSGLGRESRLARWSKIQARDSPGVDCPC